MAGKACSTHCTVRELVLRMDEEMSAQRAWGTQGPATDRTQVALGTDHRRCVLQRSPDSEAEALLPYPQAWKHPLPLGKEESNPRASAFPRVAGRAVSLSQVKGGQFAAAALEKLVSVLTKQPFPSRHICPLAPPLPDRHE